jgi:hypothetical protein
LLGLLDGLDSVDRVFFELLDLLLQTLLVLFIPLSVLSLDDLLGLLGHTVKLDISGSLFEILSHERQLFLLQLNFLEVLLVLKNRLHLLDLGFAIFLYALILISNDSLLD